ncbi:hypothetical protein OOJ91_13940 [Micromonospora lupini]|uniref:hypothetical protein n=1 Tax=Micromonospora lupini TaxID=285679 RepID=UPI002255BE63|nr:hypothetical protein [Micromonospora lupini]MCX5066949.1 hypothetical protein [Micromonospora lupini]
MGDLNLDTIEQQSLRYTGAAGADQSWLARELAGWVPGLIAEVKRLRAELTSHQPQILSNEPAPDITEVRDQDGSPWHRDKDGRWCAFGVGTGAPTSWDSLVRIWGPITTVPKAADQ